jgi:hypothetical protein
MRLIDADALLKHEIEADHMGAMLVVGKGYILSAPEVDAVPVVRGEWEYEHGAWCCSKCGENNPYGVDYETNRFAAYCPSCGARMDGGHDN